MPSTSRSRVALTDVLAPAKCSVGKIGRCTQSAPTGKRRVSAAAIGIIVKPDRTTGTRFCGAEEMGEGALSNEQTDRLP